MTFLFNKIRGLLSTTNISSVTLFTVLC